MAEAKFVNIHGERIAVRDEGTGEALLLIHGMAGSSQTWRAILPQLAKKYRVIAPDLLGHGRSSKPRTDYSLGAFAVGLRDLLDELGSSRPRSSASRWAAASQCNSFISIPPTAAALS